MSNATTVAKCPKCDNLVLSVNAGHVTINVSNGAKFNGIVYTCPACLATLGVQMDPIAIKTDIVNEILRGLGRK